MFASYQCHLSFLNSAFVKFPGLTADAAPVVLRSRFPGWTLEYEHRAGETHVYGSLFYFVEITV